MAVGVNEGQSVSLSDPPNDPGADTFTYLWSVSRNGNPAAIIRRADGQLVSQSPAETIQLVPSDEGRYDITLVVTDDDGAQGTLTQTIVVDNVAPTPVFQIVSPLGSIKSNEPVAFTGTFTDPGSDQWRGVISFGDGTTLPLIVDQAHRSFVSNHAYATSGSYIVTVTVSDADGGVSSNVTLPLTVANSAPVLADDTFLIAENTANGQLVGTVRGSDNDAADTLTYQITAGNVGNAFSVDSATGKIRVADASKLDFETTTSFTLTVQVADRAAVDNPQRLTDLGNILIRLRDLNDTSPVIAASQVFTIPQTAAYGFVVGTLLASDADSLADSEELLGWEIVSGNDDAIFGLHQTTGQLTVVNRSKLLTLATPKTYTLMVSVSDGVNGSTVVPVTATVVAADLLQITAGAGEKFEGEPLTFTVQRTGDVSGTTTVNFAVTGLGTSPVDSADFGGTLPSGMLTFGPSETLKTITVTPSADALAEPDERLIVRLSSPTGNTQITTATATSTVFDDDSPLLVTSFTPTSSGFVVSFNRKLNTNVLNLYSTGSLGASDLVVAGASVGAVSGSLVIQANQREATFVRTGGILEPDTYQVTLRSSADGWQTSTAKLLDGDGNGTAGDSYTRVMTVTAPAAGAVIVSLPDFTRGFGQTVNVPAPGVGIPLTLSRGTGISGLDLRLSYDPTLLNVTDFTPTLDGVSATFNPATGLLTVSKPTQFTTQTGPLVLGFFSARVPDTATYAGKHILKISDLAVFDDSVTPVQLASVADDAVHVAAFFGDTNASKTYNAPDATLVQRQIAQIVDGFSGYQLADPVLIADITLNGRLQANDTTSIQRVITQTPIANVPALPTGITPPPTTAADPRLFIPQSLSARPGDTVTVPVRLEVTEVAGITISGIDVALTYDAARFSISNVRAGSLLTANQLSAFSLTPNISVSGQLLVTASSSLGTNLISHGILGDVLLVDFTVLSGAAPGESTINLLRNSSGTFTALFDNDLNDLLLTPLPNNTAGDALDGRFTVTTGADTTAPSISITPNGETTNTSLIEFTFQFSEIVNGFDASDVVVTNGSAGTFTMMDRRRSTDRRTAEHAGRDRPTLPSCW